MRIINHYYCNIGIYLKPRYNGNYLLQLKFVIFADQTEEVEFSEDSCYYTWVFLSPSLIGPWYPDKLLNQNSMNSAYDRVIEILVFFLAFSYSIKLNKNLIIYNICNNPNIIITCNILPTTWNHEPTHESITFKLPFPYGASIFIRTTKIFSHSQRTSINALS